MLKIVQGTAVSDKRHPCLTPAVVLNHSLVLQFLNKMFVSVVNSNIACSLVVESHGFRNKHSDKISLDNILSV